ncbi:glycoside hydrolase family 16 protein [Pseudochryseolinea flava]|uniref:Glycoside hydrolase family 16 protein n=1 Tax=Pseudochryseolinea flava TaxID=2059302 RepID=A0A364Y4C3_9BACT|nr:glycoside hydrolase family 16 protein [Pseudochryseolinea flava]RAW01800.1 glycoside hydrolase family 16 protein [Pseudochryseolinea flava]
MKFFITFLFIAICAAQTSAQKLVWSDEFNTPGAPDSTKWNYDLGVGNPSGWGNNELQCYTNDRKNAWIEKGHLIIEARKDQQQGKPYTSARLVTRKKGDWLYGKVEVRAKLPHGKGTWPAIWMLSTDWKYGGWPESGEIDIMEHVGYDMNVVHGTIHTLTYNHVKQTQKEGKVTMNSVDNEFHIYGLEWTKDKMDFLVDGKVYYTVTRGQQDTWKEWPFDQRFHLILNIAVGGNWGGREGVDESIWPQRMMVDYVRIYQ